MNKKTPVVGDAIQHRCRKCGKTTQHQILAMGEELPSLIQCATCQHVITPRKLPSRPPVDRKKPEREAWAAMSAEMDSSKATAYSMATPCKIKTLIDHPVFGLGVVQRPCGPQKMIVLFADGEKTMRCR